LPNTGIARGIQTLRRIGQTDLTEEGWWNAVKKCEPSVKTGVVN